MCHPDRGTCVLFDRQVRRRWRGQTKPEGVLAYYLRYQKPKLCVVDLETSRHAASGCRRRWFFARLHDLVGDEKRCIARKASCCGNTSFRTRGSQRHAFPFHYFAIVKKEGRLRVCVRCGLRVCACRGALGTWHTRHDPFTRSWNLAIGLLQ